MQIVLLPGWGQSCADWRNISQKLRCNTNCLDLPGFGTTKIINSEWSIKDFADWVSHHINSNDKIILLGHSFGGRIALELAARNPKWLKGLILSGAPCIYRPGIQTKIKVLLAKSFKHIIPLKIRNRYLPPDLREAKKMGMEQTFRKSVRYDQYGLLPKVTVPTLLIWGEKDKNVPLYIAKKMNEKIKESILRTIDSATHNCFLDNPVLFTGYVNDFIKNI